MCTLWLEYMTETKINKTGMVKILHLGPNTNPLAMPFCSDGLKR